MAKTSKKTQNRTVVIEDASYGEEARALALDPIIIGMEATLPKNVDLESWDFIHAALREYNKRGGTKAHSIGGPARAIAIVRNSK